MREGMSPVPLGRFAITILAILLAYCAVFWLPLFTDATWLGISINVWAGLSLFVVAPALGLVYTLRTPVQEQDDIVAGEAS